MQVQACVYEINGLDKEIKRLQDQVKILRKRKNVLMKGIIDQMSAEEQSSILINGKEYKLTERTTHSRKGEQKKRADILSILRECGITEAEEVCAKIGDAVQGNVKTNVVLATARR